MFRKLKAILKYVYYRFCKGNFKGNETDYDDYNYGLDYEASEDYRFV